MKKVFKSMVALLAIGSLLVSSCKKGENDPFISVKSRTSRLSGEWKLTGGTVKETQTSGSSTTTTTTTFTETTKTEVEVTGSSTTTDIFNYTQDISFDKTGLYTSVIVETQTSADGSDIPSSFQVTTTDDDKGLWAFLGKNKESELKRKEAIAITPKSGTTTTVTSLGTTVSSSIYEGWSFGAVTVIDQLKSKELILKGTYSSASGSSTTTTEYEYIYTAK